MNAISPIAPIHSFYVGLRPGRRAGMAARFLDELLRAVPVGDWPRLIALARRANSLGHDDRLGVMQTYARICSAWRGEKATDDNILSPWDRTVSAEAGSYPRWDGGQAA